MIPVILIEHDATGGWATFARVANWVIWAIFALEYAVVLTVAPRKRANERAPIGHAFSTACGCAAACSIHGHAHASAWTASIPSANPAAFWGALGCSCWAV